MTTPNDFLQLVGTDTPDAPGAAYLCATYNPKHNPGNPDAYRVHFNLPEGTQRFCGEAGRVRIPRTDLILLTRFSHETIMGLPGYVLTAQDGILTGKQKALTGKTSQNGGAVPPVGITNKQKQAESVAATANGGAPPVASSGRTFLVGAPVARTPLVQWWESMVSMYFHYRPKGVIDLGFVSHSAGPPNDNIRQTDNAVGPITSRPMLFCLALNGDSTNGIANSDFYSGQAALPQSSSRNDDVGHCCSTVGVGLKRSRSDEDGCSSDNIASGSRAVAPADNIASLPPIEVLLRLTAGGASHVMAVQTSSAKEAVASYWCRFPPPPPSFDVKVAKEVFGVRSGPKYGVLKGGGTVDSDTMFGPDGVTPLKVSLADVVAAAAAAGLKDSPSKGWTNALIIDGDDAQCMLNALTEAIKTVREGLKGACLGKLTVAVILCPSSVKLPPSFAVDIAKLFGSEDKNNSLRLISGRQGLLSADDIHLRHYDEPPVALTTPLAVSAFPTALAHRMHLNALAGTYFPMMGQSMDMQRPLVMGSTTHPLTLTQADKVWWPYSLLYKLTDGQCINGPRVPEYNKILEEETKARLAPPPAPMAVVPKEELEVVPESSGKKQAKTPKTPKVAGGLPPVNRDAQEQDPPLRYPTPALASEMLSCGLGEKVRAYGSGNGLEELAAFGVDGSAVNTSPSVAGNNMLFLGTGSAVPSKYRNVSGLVVGNTNQRSESGAHPLLLTNRLICDFGEGSLGQWAQFLGPTEQYQGGNSYGHSPLELALLTTRLVFISHNHADHVLGIFALLDHFERACTSAKTTALSDRSEQPLLVVCPRNFREFLQRTVPLLCPYVIGASSRVEALPTQDGAHSLSPRIHILDLEPLIVTDTAVAARTNKSRDYLANYLHAHFGPEAHATVIPVDHPAHAHALFFRTSADWSWCYSGDTRPWPLMDAVAVTKAYAPLRILVHECTFDDDLQVEAVYKKHSTLSEALGAGVRCGAEHVLLNHFSQRYPKIPPAAAAAAARLVRKAESNDNADDASPLPKVPFSFSFDGMLVPYLALGTGDLEGRLPLFQWLLDEYDSWSVGTSQRLRGRREGPNANTTAVISHI